MDGTPPRLRRRQLLRRLCRCGPLSLLRALNFLRVWAPADFRDEGPDGDTPLALAAGAGRLRTITWLLAARPDLGRPEVLGAAFTRACASGRAPVVWWFARRGDVSLVTTCSYAPLRAACGGEHWALAAWLVERFRLRERDDFWATLKPEFVQGIEAGHPQALVWAALDDMAADVDELRRMCDLLTIPGAERDGGGGLSLEAIIRRAKGTPAERGALHAALLRESSGSTL